MAGQYHIIVSDRAKRMLGEHIRFLAKINKKAAAEKREQFIKAMSSLSEMPQRFAFFNEPFIPQNKYHKMFVERWYLILYQIQDNIVYIDFIIDCRKDYYWLLNEL